MFYKFNALAVLLVFGGANLLAQKSDSSATGTVVHYETGTKIIKLKTGNGEKDYKAGKEILLVFPDGEKFKAFTKTEKDPLMLTEKRNLNFQTIGRALRAGNEVELTLANDTVTEVHVTHMASPPSGKSPPRKQKMPSSDQ
jgi:hypothetical protein